MTMKVTVFGSLAVIAATAVAQDRCDAPYPNVYCNTTEILNYQSSSCTAFHVFIVRGSDEPYPGRLGNITREICSAIGSNYCGFENIEYPAKSTAWGKDEWCKSASKGQTNGQAQMKSYSQKCPNAKLILLGFSQGGAVAQDILGGGGGKVFECEQADSPALDPTSVPGSKVVAAVTFGAVIRSRNQKNFTIGDGVNFDGHRARTPSQLEALNKYSDRLRDYCHYGDPMCAVGSTPENVYNHLDYFLKHNEEVVPYVIGKAKANSGQVSDGNKTSSPSPSPSSSSTVAPAPEPSPPSSAKPALPPSSSEPSPSPRRSNTSVLDPSTSSHTNSPPNPSTSFLPSTSSQANTPSQSSSPPSVIATPAFATSTPTSIATKSATGSSVAQPAQITGSTSTGATSTLFISGGLVSLLVALTMALS